MRNGAKAGKAAVVCCSAALMATFIYWRATGALPFMPKAPQQAADARRGSVTVIYGPDAGDGTGNDQLIPSLNAVSAPSLADQKTPIMQWPPPVNAAPQAAISSSKFSRIVQPADITATGATAPPTPQQLIMGSKSAELVHPWELIRSSLPVSRILPPSLRVPPSEVTPIGTVVIPRRITTPVVVINAGSMVGTSKSGRIVDPSTVIRIMQPDAASLAGSALPPLLQTLPPVVAPPPELVPPGFTMSRREVQMFTSSKSGEIVSPGVMTTVLTLQRSPAATQPSTQPQP